MAEKPRESEMTGAKSAMLAGQWSRAQPIVSAFVRSMVFDFQDAEDVVQQVAVIAANRFDDFDPERPFVPWVLGIARNVAIRHNQTRRRENAILLDHHLMEQITAEFERSQARYRDVVPSLDICMKRLTDRARTLLLLRYIRDLSPSEIADRLGTTPNTVSVTLNRIRKTLRECIETRMASKSGR